MGAPASVVRWVPRGRVTAGSPENVASLRPLHPSELGRLEERLPPALPEVHRDWLAEHRAGRATWLVAWGGDGAAGYGLIHWGGPRDAAIARALPGCPEIFALRVHPDDQSQGLGRRLVAALEELALGRGCAQVGLGVAVANPRAESLYRRLGYRDADAPRYRDRWAWLDAEGTVHPEADECRFLVKPLARGG